MSGALARILGDALRAPGRSIETTDGAPELAENLAALAERTRRRLIERGVQPAEPVHARFGNRPSDLGVLLGIWNAGAVAVPLHAAAAPATIVRVQRASGARLSVDGEQLDVIAPSPPAPRELLRDAALVIFTSGSTGEPKGVVIGHQRLAGKLAVLDRLLKIQSADVVLSPLQNTFIFGLWVSLLTLMKAARLVLVPKFSSEVIARGLEPASVLAGVPSMFRTMLSDRPDLVAPKLRMILTGGEVLAPTLAHTMRRVAPAAAMFDLYGLTETGSCDFCLGPDDQPDGFGTIGKPTEGVTFRIAPNGGEAAGSANGELQIRTPFGMLGYLDQPELTKASFDDGYFRTGDLAQVLDTSSVALIGRAKDIISRGGNKIAPLEIDNLLAQHPDVAAALCAGVPTSGSAKRFTPLWCRAPESAWTRRRSANGCSRAPSVSKCRTCFISAMRCRAARAAKPIAAR